MKERRELSGQLDDLERIGNLLSWDQETKLPRAGAASRAEQRADITRAGSLGIAAWWEALATADYELLLPHLERQIELKRRYVECFDGFDEPYDVLLDDYEEDMRATEVDAIFDVLKRELIPLVKDVAAAEPVDDSFLRTHWDQEAQRSFSLHVLDEFGFDPTSWRLDDAQHPFASAPAPRDIRITARFDLDNIHGVFPCLHEFGHGIYERQVADELFRTPLAHGASSALHESQSRMWENLIGRSRPFWARYYPRLQEAFPEQLGRLELEAFYRG